MLPTCNGGTVIAFGQDGGVWLTTDGGDGALREDDTSAVIISAIPRIKACDASKARAKIFSNACPNGLRVDSIALVGDTVHFSLDSVAKLPTSFGGGTSDSFYVRFTPLKQSGTFTTQLHVRGMNILPDTSLPFDTLITITATATPEPPSLLSDLTQFNFDSLSTCDGLRDTSVVFVNTGCTSDTLRNVSTLGSGFSWLRDSLPIIIASSDSVRLRFRFVPPDSGSFSGTAMLTVTSMGLTQTPQLEFSGAGVRGSGILEMQSASLQAGSFSFCAGDTTLTDTLRNTGCDTLFLRGAALAGDTAFTLLNQLPQYLLPRDSAVVQIQFSPRRKGPHATTLSISTKDSSFNIPVAGVGLPGTRIATLSTRSLDLGTTPICQERDTFVVIQNTGCDTVCDSLVTVAPGTFQLAKPWSARCLAPGERDTVWLSTAIDTNGQHGQNVATLSVVSNADSALAPITLMREIQYPAVWHLTISAPDSAYPGQPVTYKLLQHGTLPNDDTAIDFVLHYDDDLITFQSVDEPFASAGQAQAGSTAPRVTSLPFHIGPVPADSVLAILHFTAYLAPRQQTTITVDSITFSSQPTRPSDCIALAQVDTSGFTLRTLCGATEILQELNNLPLTLDAIVPNPSHSEVTLYYSLAGSESVTATVVIEDALGRMRLSQNVQLDAGPRHSITLDLSGMVSGVYNVRLSTPASCVARRLVKE